MLSALLNMLKNLTESNFETTPMREISENLEDSLDTVGASSSSSLDSSVTACKKVLCSNSLLDSTEYWLRNEKTLCKIGFLEDKCDSSCTTICFVNLDRDSKDQCDDTCIKKLASVSPALPKLIDSLNVKQPRDNEIFLLSGLDSSGTCPQDSSNQQSLRVADVCLVQCARGNKSSHPSCLIFEINKFLIGIESGQERQLQLERYGHHRPEDDTNRSVSSIEEDFLTASEHLEDSEEDAFRNDFENSDFVDLYTHEKNPGGLRSDRHRNIKELYKEPQWSEESGATPHGAPDKHVKLCHSSSLQNTAELHAKKAYQSKRQGFSSSSQVTRNRHSTVPRQSATAQHNLPSTPETAGYYATNLAESVLQDAFIKLSQEEPTFTAEAALSVSAESNTVLTSKREDPKPARSYSFELPKIVIVQSPDNCESMIEWPGTPSSSPDTWVEHDIPKDVSHQPLEEHGQHCSFGSSRRTPKPVEVALACAASVIGTISSPKATEKLKIDPSMVVPESQTTDDYEEDENEEFAEPNREGKNYSFSSALCGMTQVASAVAVVDLTEEEQDEIYSPSRGLLSVAEASTAITLHCSVAIGTKIDQFKTNIAEVLLKEASSVLTKPENHKSVADFLESTHNKIVASITKPNTSNLGETEMDDLAHILSNAIFKHSLEKAMKKRELESPSKDISNLQGLVLENTSNLILDVLRITCKKISDISHHGKPSSDILEDKPSSKDSETIVKESKGPLNQLLSFIGSTRAVNNENQTTLLCCKDNLSRYTGIKEENVQEQKESEPTNTSCSAVTRDQRRPSQANVASLVNEFNSPQGQPSKNNVKDSKTSETDKTMSIFESKQTFQEMFSHNGSFTEKHKGSTLTDDDNTSNSLSSEQLLLPPMVTVEAATEGKSPVSGFADDLATTVVSMATEMAAICLENSHGKQPWFCAWKGGPENPENYLMPCRTVKRKKDVQSNAAVTKKHRPPRLSEIKKKTEEQPELMERLMNRVVDESMNLDEPPDPFTLFATELTAKIMNCPELNVVDTSKPGHPRNRLQCDRWSRGKASSYESIPEEDGDSSSLINALSPGARLGQNMSRGSSISKQSSCESITDEFSRFMVNQMENEGRGFDLLLDYYAGKNANSILSSAMQQVTKKNGHLNVRSTCLSKQSSTESITEEFYRFMLKEMDKENKDYNVSKTKEWSNSLLPPTPRTPFCFRQSSMPDRRSSDSRLTVNSPMKANSFDGFARNIHGDTLNIYPGNSASSMGLCKSDSCLYQRGQTDQITDMLIHETWSNSIESLMRKNKIIVDEEESIDLEQLSDSQPHVEQFANQLAADIVESGKSLLGGQQESVSSRPPIPLAEKRRCFKSHLRQPASDKARSTQEKTAAGNNSGCVASLPRSPREVPLIHIEADQREEFKEDTRHHDLTASSSVTPERECHPQEKPTEVQFDPGPEKMSLNSSSLECNKTVITSVVENASASEECTNNISSSDESTGSWLQIANEEDLPEDTSSYIQLSEGNGNSSTSSLGFVDLESLQESCSPCKSLSEESEEKERLKENLENVDECTSGLSIGASSSHKELLVMNFDLDPECVDSELRATLQWIAASELGVPTIYFRKSQEKSIEKFLDMVQTVHQKDWNIGDLFHAVVQYCKLQEESDTVTSLFDWLLEKR